MVSFRYFKAPLKHIAGYSTSHRCSFCKRIRPSTEIEENRFCCLGCLSDGRHNMWHDTSLGTLEDGRLRRWDTTLEQVVEVGPPEGFNLEALEVLGRNPRINAFQGECFLVHCDDFMRYIGRWEPEDFMRLAPENPRAAYTRIAGDSQLWDDTEREKKSYGRDWPAYRSSRWAYGSWCYMFECIECGTLDCLWDCD